MKSLREELEILRGEPIEVFVGDPMDIPCIETSDPEKLCKHPVVSVHMVTYNHEPYIRQAIEGVMMQETDFEFELVIGEDASTDKTREICFEYQKKYSDKIRVLWWHENLYRNPQLGGTNGLRNMAHLRGEFVAFCEGDDYWIDPLKLQKQVDIMRKHPNVGFCYCGAFDYSSDVNLFRDFYLTSSFPVGLMLGKEYLHRNIYGMPHRCELGRESYVRTATALVRVSVLNEARQKYEVLNWRLRLGDVPLWLSLASLSDVYYLQDRVAVYRQNPAGACATLGASLLKDNYLVRIYYCCSNDLTGSRFLSSNYLPILSRSLLQLGRGQDAAKIVKFIHKTDKFRWLLSDAGFVLQLLMATNCLTASTFRKAIIIHANYRRVSNLVQRAWRRAKRLVGAREGNG